MSFPTTYRLTANRRVDHSDAFLEATREIVRPASVARASREIPTWPGYERTTLRNLTDLAKRFGVAAIWYKDESSRFGVGSFKPMGGGYAVSRIVVRHVQHVTGAEEVTVDDLLSGRFRALAGEVTVTCATDGNHGRSVAWASRLFGCRAVIYMASIVSPARERAMTELGAEVIRSSGNHEIASDECAVAARANDWYVVSETARATEAEIAYDTLAGYRTLLGELDVQQQGKDPPTHMFVQAGVGGLAATACAYAAERWGADRPVMVVVESDQADCIRQSIATGSAVAVEGDLDTIMAGLAAGEASGWAWSILRAGADFAMAIPDAAAILTMRALGEAGVIGGESGVAGLAAALVGAADPAARQELGLDPSSKILTIGTEGATDLELYERLVGRAPAKVSRASAGP